MLGRGETPRPASTLTPGILPWLSGNPFYLLHCLPGGNERKVSVFDHLRQIATDVAILLVATVVPAATLHSHAAKSMALYNRWGIFPNTHHTAERLEPALAARCSLACCGPRPRHSLLRRLRHWAGEQLR